MVFKQRNIFVLYGDPGDSAGSGNSLQPARLLSGDVGCSSVHSIVEGPFGVAFLSERGLYTLGRGLDLTFVGAPVMDTTRAYPVCTSGVLVPSESEVRWTLSSAEGEYDDGIALSYNYRLDRWSKWTGYETTHSCLWRGRHARLGTGLTPWVETPYTWTFLDEDELEVTTPWIRLAGMQGYKRVWRTFVLGRWYSGDFSIDFEYDYRDGVVSTAHWTGTELAAMGERLQVRARPTQQKCEAIRLTLRETPGNSGSPGRGVELVAVQMDCGVKRGGMKRLAAEAKA